MAGSTPGPGRAAKGLGLFASLAALATGGVALGMELERRIVAKRLRPTPDEPTEPFLTLRSDGPVVTTPDGVVLHTETDELSDHPPPGGTTPIEDITLVLVHGYALNMDCWHFQRKHFRGRIRMVLYDQRSHGRSGRSAPENCRIDQLSKDLLQVLDEVVGAGPVVLAGHSMGGMTIMHLALTHPELFGPRTSVGGDDPPEPPRSSVGGEDSPSPPRIDSGGDDPPEPPRIVGVALFSTAAGEMADHSPIRGLPGRLFSRAVEPAMAVLNRIPELVEQSRSAGSDLSFVVTKRGSYGSDVPASYVDFMIEMLGQTPLEVVGDFYPAFAELDEYEAFGVLATVETAVIGGEDDVITPVSHTDKIIELLPGADVRRLAECGHMGIIEHHGIFNQVLEQLIVRARLSLAALQQNR